MPQHNDPLKERLVKEIAAILGINHCVHNPLMFCDICSERMMSAITTYGDAREAEVRAEIKDFVLPKATKFIKKVESGMARSKETYADMKAIEQFFS